MKLRDLFYYREYGSDWLRLWVPIAAIMVPILVLVVVGVTCDARDVERRYAECMHDKHDKYFCDSWAHRRAVAVDARGAP